MPSLLSGSKLRTGGSGQFLKLADAMPQLPPSPSTSTGYTIITSDTLVTTYASSLGNIQFTSGTMYSNVTGQPIQLIGTGTTSIIVAGGTTATNTNTGALVVQGGASIWDDLWVGGATHLQNLTVEVFTATTATVLTLHVTSTQTSLSTSTGALVVDGGVGIGKNLIVGSTANFLSTATFETDTLVKRDAFFKGEVTVDGTGAVTLSPTAASVTIQPALGGSVTIQPSSTGHMNNVIVGEFLPQNAYFLDAHANNFIGLATTSTNIEKGYLGSIPYQTGTGTTAFIDIGPAGAVLTSNGTTATWSNGASIVVNTATNSINSQILAATGTEYLVMTTGTNGVFTPLADSISLSYNTQVSTLSTPNLTVTNTATIIGSVYSREGSPDYNNLLYTPRVTISTTAPLDPRIGDFWINPTYGVECQYINDGGNKFWVQFTGL